MNEKPMKDTHYQKGTNAVDRLDEWVCLWAGRTNQR